MACVWRNGIYPVFKIRIINKKKTLYTINKYNTKKLQCKVFDTFPYISFFLLFFNWKKCFAGILFFEIRMLLRLQCARTYPS